MGKIKIVSLTFSLFFIFGVTTMATSNDALDVVKAKKTVPSPAPSPGSDVCTTLLYGLASCLDYIQGNSTSGPPSKDCCDGLKNVVNTNVVCLCNIFTTNNPLGKPVDQNKALPMAKSCKVSTPPVSSCNAAGIPIAAPTTSTTGTPRTSPTGSSPSNGTATKTPSSSSPDSSPSRGVSDKGIEGFLTLLFAVLMTAYASSQN